MASSVIGDEFSIESSNLSNKTDVKVANVPNSSCKSPFFHAVLTGMLISELYSEGKYKLIMLIAQRNYIYDSLDNCLIQYKYLNL